jgi:glycosyltransferase involved in cell wall biosynthesis
VPRDRLAVFTPSLGGGGAERHLIRLLPALAAAFDTHLVTLKSGGALTPDVPPDVALHEMRVRGWIRGAIGARKILRRLRPGVVLALQEAANVPLMLGRQGLIAQRRPRVALSVQNTLSSVLIHSKPRTAARLRIAVRALYPRADAIIAVSRGVARDLEEICAPLQGRISVIFNAGVDSEIQGLASQPCNHAFFQDRNVPVLVACGRLTEQKDYPTLLKALALVRRTQPARLIVLGDGPLAPSLKSMATDLALDGAVDFPGFTRNPFMYFRHASAFVLSSRWEGLPTVLPEALACGAPVIATDCPHGPLEILDGGTYGRLVPPGDPSRLAEAIEGLLRDPAGRQLLAERGPERAAMFSAERAGFEYVSLLRHLLG